MTSRIPEKEIIAVYVREQQRYTKAQLAERFCFDLKKELDCLELDRFIKNLRACGILKIVANSTDQQNLTDLAQEDVLPSEETAGADGCLYVFTWVGVVTAGRRVIKAYPKYILSDEAPAQHLKTVLRVLERYGRAKQQAVHLFHGDEEGRHFDLLAVMLYLLRDYYENGVYTNTQKVLEVNGEGDILWERTIGEGFAVIQKGIPYHIELFTRRTEDDEADYIRRLHACILTDCSRRLHAAGLDELFDMEAVCLFEEEIGDFGEREYILERITRALRVQYVTRRRVLLKTLYAYLAQDRGLFSDEQGVNMIGTASFHVVWEKVCAEIFDNKLNTPVAGSGLQGHFPDNRPLIELIEKPVWRTGGKDYPAADTLRPDLISIQWQDGVCRFVILDAKYYLIQPESGQLYGIPGVQDVAKQYLYQLAYQQLTGDCAVQNGFLMPLQGTKKDPIVKAGSVKMELFSRLRLKPDEISIWQVPAERAYHCYLRRETISIGELP